MQLCILPASPWAVLSVTYLVGQFCIFSFVRRIIDLFFNVMTTTATVCFYRAETPPTLNEYDRRWSFKSGMENISLTVNPSHFIGQFYSFCLFILECFWLWFFRYLLISHLRISYRSKCFISYCVLCINMFIWHAENKCKTEQYPA